MAWTRDWKAWTACACRSDRDSKSDGALGLDDDVVFISSGDKGLGGSRI
ncbi:hypothetical protein [Synechococcus sp. WH 8016]|nr:hypothetical protein [Synechococcus sp. WH 8016]